MNIEQAAKALHEALPILLGNEGEIDVRLEIIAKHLEAFAREQNLTDEALSKQRETLVLKLEAENRELLKDKERLNKLEDYLISGKNLRLWAMDVIVPHEGILIRQEIDKAALAKERSE